MQSRDRTFYQYALLNLAILQADFGCYSEAIPAMQEAIATARENKDTACLNFCMSWLHHFGKAFPAEMKELRDSGILGSETESLAFLKSRTKDTEMWSLLSTTLLNEAKLGLQHGDSLAQIFETIAKAKHIAKIGVRFLEPIEVITNGEVLGHIALPGRHRATISLGPIVHRSLSFHNSHCALLHQLRHDAARALGPPPPRVG